MYFFYLDVYFARNIPSLKLQKQYEHFWYTVLLDVSQV